MIRRPPAARHGNAIKAGGRATAGLVGRRVRGALRRRKSPAQVGDLGGAGRRYTTY